MGREVFCWYLQVQTQFVSIMRMQTAWKSHRRENATKTDVVILGHLIFLRSVKNYAFFSLKCNFWLWSHRMPIFCRIGKCVLKTYTFQEISDWTKAMLFSDDPMSTFKTIINLVSHSPSSAKLPLVTPAINNCVTRPFNLFSTAYLEL